MVVLIFSGTQWVVGTEVVFKEIIIYYWEVNIN